MKTKFNQNDVVKIKGSDGMRLMDVISSEVKNGKNFYECTYFDISKSFKLMNDIFEEKNLEFVYERDNSKFIEDYNKSKIKESGIKA